MGRVQIEEFPINHTLHYYGMYTKDIGDDDEYRPENFDFVLSVRLNEDNDDVDYMKIKWKDKKPFDKKSQERAIKEKIFNYYYTYILQ